MCRWPKIVSAALSLGLLATTPAWAASSASSAASEGASASVGSLSTSIEKSSKSSSKDDKVAEGDYRILEVAGAGGQPGSMRLTLAPVGGSADAAFVLNLPQETVARTGLAPGGVVAVRQQPYGLQFAAGTPRAPFFLALRDDWFQDLKTTAVVAL